jgi:hypothetical protein
MTLHQINGPSVPQPVTSTGLIFLSFMRYSTLSKSLHLAPELFLDQWKSVARPRRAYEQDRASTISSSSDDEDEVINEGMGLRTTMEEYGYETRRGVF